MLPRILGQAFQNLHKRLLNCYDRARLKNTNKIPRLKLNKRAFNMTNASKAFYLKQAEEVKNDNFPHLKVDIMKFPQQSLEEDPRAKVRDDLPTNNKL